MLPEIVNMKSVTDKRKEKEMSRATCVSDNVSHHSYASPGEILLSTSLPESPGVWRLRAAK